MREGRDLDAVVVGAGFAGLYALHRLRGQGLSVRVFEAGGGVGGTWYWNRYPGARCDVPSLEYSYQFSEALQQEWQWSERYAPQAEILCYLEHVADRFDLRRDIQLDTRVVSAVFDEQAGRWTVTTEPGGAVTARFCVMATGCLSVARTPELPGQDDFAGRIFHTGRWPKEGVDFTGERVGVVGTGSSGIQSIPHIARQARHLTVFQRTASYSVPAHNEPLDPEDARRVKTDYPGFRRRNAQMGAGLEAHAGEVSALAVSEAERRCEYERRWARGGLPFLSAFADLLVVPEANETAAEFIREKIREVVDDPEVAQRLCPRTEVGCKRLCVDTGYYATFNRPNVTLVDVSDAPIERLTRDGLETGDAAYALDAIVFATGFDAMTGALERIDIRGRGGLALREKWAAGPRTYLGLAVEGFPNLFTVTGPGSPSVLTNMVPSIEQHVDWIADCIAFLEARGASRVEPTRAAEDAWVAHVNELADLTIFPRCNSWYLGANVPGKPRVFMPCIGFPAYVAKCEEVVARGYEGFALG